MWVVVLVADSYEKKLCPFCEVLFQVPGSWPLEKAVEWVEENHLSIHADAMTDDHTDALRCNRCLRYEAAGIAPIESLHRPCFSASPPCFCPCSREERK